MAEQDKTILIEVDINVDKAIEKQTELKKEVSDLTKELSDYKKELESGKVTMADVIKKEAELITKKAELRTNQRLVTASLSSEKNSYNQLSAQYSNNIIKLNTLSNEYKTTTEEGKKLVQDTEAIRLEMIKAKEATADHTLKVGNYENATKSIRSEIKELTAAIVGMKLSQQEGTAEYKKAIDRLGELKDTMADVSAEAKIVGSDTKNIDMLVDSMQAVGAVGQLAESAMQAFGSENEDVAKGIQKLVIIQSAMNAVQEIQNALQKESGFMLGINTVATKSAAAAQGIYALAVGASTGAMKAFRIALLSTGIGAIVAAVAYLVVKMNDLGKTTQATTTKLAQLKKVNQDINEANEFAIKLAEKKGELESNLIDDQISANEERLDQIDEELQLLEDKLFLEAKTKEQIEEIREANQALYKERSDITAKNILLEKDYQKAIKKEEEQGEKDFAEKQQKKRDIEKMNYDLAVNNHRGYLEAKLAQTEKGSRDELDANIKLMAYNAAVEIKQAGLTAGEIMAINKKYEQRKAQLIADFNEKEKQKSIENAIKNFEIELNYYKAFNQSKVKDGGLITQQLIEQEKARVEAENKIQKDKLAFQLSNGLINKKEYDTQVRQLENETNTYLLSLTNDFSAQQADIFQANYDNRLALAQDNVFKTLELEKEGLDYKEQQEIEAAEKLGIDTTLIHEKYAKARIEIDKAERNAKLAIYSEVLGNLSSALGEGTALGKAAAVAQATINTYQGATAAYTNAVQIPVIGFALAPIAAAAAVAAGLANVKKILSVKTPGKSKSGSASVGGGNISAAAAPTIANVNPQIGQGIVSRDNSALGKGNDIKIQPTLVIDDVDSAQNKKNMKSKVSTL